MSEPAVPPPEWEAREAERIYRALFGGAIPEPVRERFILASRRLESRAEPSAVAAYRRAVDRVGDLEALEIACRYRRMLPLLSRKFRVMVTVAETVPETQSHFVNQNSSLLRGLAVLTAGGFRSVGKLAKGLMLQGRLDRG